MDNVQQQQQQSQQQQHHQASVIMPVPMNIPMMMPNQMPPQQPLMSNSVNHIPLSMITRGTPEENMQMQQKEDGPITVITREEHIIPIFQHMVPEMHPVASNSIENRGMPEKIMYHPAAPEARMMPEGRMLHTLAIPENRHMPMQMAEGRSISHSGVPVPAVPSEIVRPPPPPPAFHKIPIHVPTMLQQVENQQVNENVLDEEIESDPRPHCMYSFYE